MSMVDADKLPIRTVTIKRRMLTGKKPYYVTQRRRVVLESELELEKNRKPANQMERIQRMDAQELAWFLLTLHDGDAGGYCKMKAECLEALENGTEQEITEANCLECIKAWLLEEI